MKFKITKEEFDKLPEAFQSEYSEKDDEYVLTVEGGEDTGALKRAKDHEKARRQKAEEKTRQLEEQITEIQSQLEDLQESGDGKKKDIPAIERKWQQKLEARENELKKQTESLEKELNTLLVDNVAQSIASELSDSPNVLMPHIKARLTVERAEGKAATRIKDHDGELSPMTLDELKSEFQSNKDFASLIRGSQGSGSGASGGQGGSGGRKLEKPDMSTASTKEIAEYLKAQREAGE